MIILINPLIPPLSSETPQLLQLLTHHLHQYSSIIDNQDTNKGIVGYIFIFTLKIIIGLNNFALSVEAVISSGRGGAVGGVSNGTYVY